VPLACTIAILKHGLYDIDQLINRTLVYGVVTATLGLGYAMTVLVLGDCLAATAPAWPWRAPRWRSPRRSSRCAAASSTQ